MKKGLCVFLALVLIIGVCPMNALAVEEPAFAFELSVDGGQTKEVRTGDVITVVLHLRRTDSDAPYTMYAMQDEIRYDSSFFELVEGSVVLSTGIQSTDIGMRDQYREFYMNYLSTSGGAQWDSNTMIGSFQLRIIGTTGVTKITNEDYLVSTKDGSGSYSCEGNELTIILSTECTIRFQSNGGAAIADQIVQYGEKVSRPEDPVRDGYTFEGWYQDIDLTIPWDFENDTARGNLTLYAKWMQGQQIVPGEDSVDSENEMPWMILGVVFLLILILLLLLLLTGYQVRFNSMGGSPVKTQRVHKGKKVSKPNNPTKAGSIFMGWYIDPRCTSKWNFETNTVSKKMVLYAKWEEAV